MKVGASFWFGHRPFHEKVEELLEIGFDYFEIALDFPFPEESEELVNAIRDYDLKPAFHAPLDIMLASPRKEIFDASLKVLEKCLNFAGNFETLYFNFHVFHFTPTFLFPEIREKGIENLRKAIEFSIVLSREFGFEICMENDAFFVEDFIIGEVKLTLDLGHFIIEAIKWRRDYKKELADFCKNHGKRIHVLHVHDVDFLKICDHLPLGRGEMDLNVLKGILKDLKPKFSLLEVFWKDADTKEFATSSELRESLKLFRSISIDD